MNEKSKPNRESSKVTERIYAADFDLLEKHPEGLSWSEPLKEIQATDATLHPKTVNGCIWKPVQRLTGQIYKPSKGHFRLAKYGP